MMCVTTPCNVLLLCVMHDYSVSVGKRCVLYIMYYYSMSVAKRCVLYVMYYYSVSVAKGCVPLCNVRVPCECCMKMRACV